MNVLVMDVRYGLGVVGFWIKSWRNDYGLSMMNLALLGQPFVILYYIVINCLLLPKVLYFYPIMQISQTIILSPAFELSFTRNTYSVYALLSISTYLKFIII